MTAAITLSHIEKRFPLYNGQLARVLGEIGLSRTVPSWKVALKDISLTIARGEKVGVIGRNGSGKTTLLRLVMGHTMATRGRLKIDGTVQGLMQTGFGFNDDMSGLDNVRNSLVYNGVRSGEIEAAVADIVDFVELDEFIHHPLKTYSLGMRARLEFAAATAIKPDILVIDEVLGAGDGYFVSKCAERMRRVISNSTLMLVSHSLTQVMQYCDRVIWLDDGCIVEDGAVHLVISAYQHFMAKQNAIAYQATEDADAAQHRVAGRPDQKQTVPEAVLALLPPNERQPEMTIVDCHFTRDDPAFYVTETGELLSLRYTVRSTGSPRRVCPVIFGATHHGALVFEAVGAPVTLPDASVLQLTSRKFNIGVGNYLLVPGLRDAVSGKILCIGGHAIRLRILPTNWSDPPRLHLKGEWGSTTHGEHQLETKISAWI